MTPATTTDRPGLGSLREEQALLRARLARARRSLAAILEAEGRREAAFRDAEARERAAQAEAAATTAVSDAVEQGSVEALNYFVAQKYVEAFSRLASAPNQKTLIVPAEFGALAGAVSGVAELLRSGAAAAPSPAAPTPPRVRRAEPPAAPAPAVVPPTQGGS